MSSSAASRHPHLQETFVETAFNSVFNPGVGRGTFGVVNGILAALLLSIGAMWLLGLGGQHIYVLLFLTVGLLASLNWFSTTLIENKPTEAEEVDEQTEAADVKKIKRSGQAQQTNSSRKSAEADAEEDEEEDDEPPARRTRSRSRAKDEETVETARQTRSSSKKGNKEQTTGSSTSTTTTTSSKKKTKASK